MVRYIILFLLILIFLFRFFYLKNKGKKVNFLFLSLFIQQIPLGCIIYKIPINISKSGLMGALDTFLSIDVSFGIIILILLFKIPKIRDLGLFDYKGVLIVSLTILIISILNPLNNNWLYTIPIFFRASQIFILLLLLNNRLKYSEFLFGLFDGFKISILFQAFLVVLYPILGISFVTELFRGGEIGVWTERREGYSSAIGTFMHPGSLALFATFSLIFFVSSRLYKFKVKESNMLIFVSLFVIYFTFSRTSYVSSLISGGFILFVFLNREKIKISTFIGTAVVFSLLILIVQATPIYDLFFKSDSEMQLESRLIHFGLAQELWTKSKIFGLGINNHVTHMIEMNSIMWNSVPLFFFENPIHNIHLIVLVETGLLGFIVWLFYFFSRIYLSIKYCKLISSASIINLSYSGVLLAFLLYGMAGWSGFHREIYPFIILIGMSTVFKTPVKKMYIL